MTFEEKKSIYDRVTASDSRLDQKGKNMLYTSVNGHMFSFLSQDGTLAIRISDQDREIFVNKFHSGPVEQYGRVMKEYTEVPDFLLSDEKTLLEYFKRSFEYVSSLKPKVTKK